MSFPTPKEIVAELDKYIIDQEKAQGEEPGLELPP